MHWHVPDGGKNHPHCAPDGQCEKKFSATPRRAMRGRHDKAAGGRVLRRMKILMDITGNILHALAAGRHGMSPLGGLQAGNEALPSGKYGLAAA
jgi:hypothetical protein